MVPTCVLSAPGGPHVGPMNLAMRDEFDTRCHDLEKLYALLILCEGDLPVTTTWIPLTKEPVKWERWCFLCCYFECVVELQVIWDTLTLMWHPCNVNYQQTRYHISIAISHYLICAAIHWLYWICIIYCPTSSFRAGSPPFQWSHQWESYKPQWKQC